MKLVVNGKPYDLGAEPSLAALLASLGANPDRVAVMVNERVVRAAERSALKLREGDKVEVLHLMGGG